MWMDRSVTLGKNWRRCSRWCRAAGAVGLAEERRDPRFGLETVVAGQIARALGRSPSTISRVLRRNAASRGSMLEYRASVAQ